MQPVLRRFLYISLLAAGLVWMWLSAPAPDSITNGEIPAPQAGFLAPNFTLETLDGQQINLHALRGKPIVINFWASWCPPCRAEMPAMESAYEAFAEQGLVILAVNATSQDSLADVRSFVQGFGLTFPILLDYGQAMSSFQVRSLPSTFFVGADGIIQEVVIGGPMAEALLLTRIETLLKETP